VQAPEYYEYYHIMQIYDLDLTPPKPNMSWISGIATIMFAYSCHAVFFYLRGELRSKTTKRVSKVIRNALTVEVLLYVAISFAGYISLGNHLTPDIYFLRRPLRKFLFLQISQIFPLQIFPLQNFSLTIVQLARATSS
jgi:amino acid permease